MIWSICQRLCIQIYRTELSMIMLTIFHDLKDESKTLHPNLKNWTFHDHADDFSSFEAFVKDFCIQIYRTELSMIMLTIFHHLKHLSKTFASKSIELNFPWSCWRFLWFEAFVKDFASKSKELNFPWSCWRFFIIWRMNQRLLHPDL